MLFTYSDWSVGVSFSVGIDTNVCLTLRLLHREDRKQLCSEFLVFVKPLNVPFLIKLDNKPELYHLPGSDTSLSAR